MNEEKNDPNSEDTNSPKITRTVLSKAKELRKPLYLLFSRRKNILERQESFSRTFRSAGEEPSTEHNFNTHTTEEPLTGDRKNFLLKFFQKIKDKFEVENV